MAEQSGADFYSAFAQFAAGRNPSPGALAGFLQSPRTAGLSVYRNNIAIGAADVLAQGFPAVRRLVGERFFTAMAVAFRDAFPPRSAVMALYGDAFPGFVGRFPPAASLPYLADVALLDRAWTLAHHAPDRPVLQAGVLDGLTPDALQGHTLALHPSVQSVTSPFPAYSIWRTNRDDETVSRVSLPGEAEAAIVWRQANVVRHHRLSAVEQAFLSAVTEGMPIGVAMQRARQTACPPDPFQLARGLVEVGLFERLHP